MFGVAVKVAVLRIALIATFALRPSWSQAIHDDPYKVYISEQVCVWSMCWHQCSPPFSNIWGCYSHQHGRVIKIKSWISCVFRNKLRAQISARSADCFLTDSVPQCDQLLPMVTPMWIKNCSTYVTCSIVIYCCPPHPLHSMFSSGSEKCIIIHIKHINLHMSRLNSLRVWTRKKVSTCRKPVQTWAPTIPHFWCKE